MIFKLTTEDLQVKPICNIRNLLMTALGAWVALTAGFAMADESTEQVAIPDTPAAIWLSIDEQINALDGLLASGELEEVHHHAFAVRDLVRTLPDHSQGLGQESLEQVKANVGYVETLATRLDEAGDSNDPVGTKANLEKLKRILSRIRANYPGAK